MYWIDIFASLWLYQTICYSRKFNHQNLQRVHPKDTLGLVGYVGKLLANFDG
jgi:hypothetical protein